MVFRAQRGAANGGIEENNGTKPRGGGENLFTGPGRYGAVKDRFFYLIAEEEKTKFPLLRQQNLKK